jgi:hypothetical protein
MCIASSSRAAPKPAPNFGPAAARSPRAGIEVGVIAVLHQASLDARPERFYRYFAEELGLDNFQVNTPFLGGPASKVEGGFHLDNDSRGFLPAFSMSG